jgi:T5SS/PEP-CTERM-associated repeat protein
LRVASGTINSAHVLIGDASAAGSALTVSGGAQWNSQGRVTVGKNGQAQLLIENGATMTSAEGRVADGSADASAIVRGNGSQWNSGNLLIGGGLNGTGAGNITVEGGGRVLSDAVVVGHSPQLGGPGGSTGSLTVRTGGTMEAAQSLNVGPGSTVLVEHGGSLQIADALIMREQATVEVSSTAAIAVGAGASRVGALRVGSAGSVSGNGTINGNVDLENGGTIVVGPSDTTGTLTINGNVTQQRDGEMWFRIQGSHQHDALEISGAATFNGNLRVGLMEAEAGQHYRPAPAETFKVIGTQMAPQVNFNTGAKIVEAHRDADGQTAGMFDIVTNETGVTLSGFRAIHALSIGIDDATVAGGADARMVRDAFATLPGVATNSVVARDSFHDVGNSAAIARAIDNAAAAVRPGDTFVLFVSSHGGFDEALGADHGETPIRRQTLDGDVSTFGDFTTTQTELWVSGRPGEDQMIPASEIRMMFDDTRWEGVNKLFVMDTCYSGGFWSDPEGDPLVSYLSSLDHAAIIAAAPNHLFAYAMNDGKGFLATAFADSILDLKSTENDLFSLVDSIHAEQNTLFRSGDPVLIKDFSRNGWGTPIFVDGLNPLFAAATADFSFGLVGSDAIPEPGSLAIIVLLTSGLLHRRRRAA